MPKHSQSNRSENQRASSFWTHPDLEQVGQVMKSFSIGQSPSGISEMAKEHLGAGGKRFRALMALQTASILRVPAQAAVSWAAAVELIHNATLIHDDIQDGDEVRRGQPTVWKRHGVAQAINVGDLLLMVPYQILSGADLPAKHLRRLLACFSHRTVETVRGQSLEMTLRDHLNFDRDTYVQALRGKTGQLLALAIEGPLVLSDMDPLKAGAIASGFESLGIAFQIYDDIRDLYADKGRGQIGNDLREGKVSALTVAHLASCPDDREALTHLLRKPFDDVRRDEVSFWAKRFEASGARATCENWAEDFVAQALTNVAERPLRDFVQEVADALGLLKGRG